MEADAFEGVRTACSLEDKLAAAARFARCPISGFAVGAVGKLEDGRWVPGFNLECPGVPIDHTIHAEQAALALSVHLGSPLVELWVTAAPCGHCRQLLCEWCPDLPIRVLGSPDSAPGGRKARDWLPGPGFPPPPRAHTELWVEDGTGVCRFEDLPCSGGGPGLCALQVAEILARATGRGPWLQARGHSTSVAWAAREAEMARRLGVHLELETRRPQPESEPGAVASPPFGQALFPAHPPLPLKAWGTDWLGPAHPLEPELRAVAQGQLGAGPPKAIEGGPGFGSARQLWLEFAVPPRRAGPAWVQPFGPAALGVRPHARLCASAGSKDLATWARAAAGMSWAPYTGCATGCAIRARGGVRFATYGLESVAFNPSVDAATVAAAALDIEGISLDHVSEVVFAEPRQVAVSNLRRVAHRFRNAEFRSIETPRFDPSQYAGGNP